MTLVTVTATLTEPGGTPWKYATVTIGVVGAAFVQGQVGVQTANVTRAKSDVNGLVSVALQPLGTDSYYVWNPPKGGGLPLPFRPPTTGGPYTLQSCLLGVPGYPVLDVGMSKAEADGSYVLGQAVSSDGSHGLPTPTGSGLELVFTSTGLDDIRFNGVSQ